MSRKAARKLLTVLFAAAGLASLAGAPAASATTCTKVASPSGSDSASGAESAPYRTPQKLASSLSAGQTGCLRGGSYTTTSTYILAPSRGGSSGAPITVTSYPGERAKLVGIVHVPNGVNHVTFSKLDFEGTGASNTIKIYSADVVVEDSDITNAWRGLSCMMLGSNSGAGQALRTVVRRNRFHECGNPANGNKDHGIYAANLADGEIVDNLIYNSAAYAIQFYPNTHGTRFAHNVVDGGGSSVRGGVIFAGEGSYASGNNTVEQNVISYSATYNITSHWGGSAGVGNVARSNCVWAGQSGDIAPQDGFTATGNKTADPGFVGRSSHDYRLKAGSPCLATVGYDTAAKLAGALSTEPAPAPSTTTTTEPAPSTTTTTEPAPTTTTTQPAPTTTTTQPAPTTTTTQPAPTTTSTTTTTTTKPRPRKKASTSTLRSRRAARRCRTRRAKGTRGSRSRGRAKSKPCRAKRLRSRRGRRAAR